MADLIVLPTADNEALRAVNRLSRLLELVGKAGASPPPYPAPPSIPAPSLPTFADMVAVAERRTRPSSTNTKEVQRMTHSTCRHCGLVICRVQRGKVWAHHDTLSVIIHRSQRLGCAVSHDPEPEEKS